jgi:hypothetical protein
MNYKTSFAIIAGLAAAAISLHAQTQIDASQIPNLNGRIQYGAAPGQGAESLKFVDQSLPQKEIRVGPSKQNGVGLGYIIAFETDSETRNKLMMSEMVEFVVDVLNTAMGGTPSPMKVVLLTTAGGSNPEHFAQFGAWNNAEQLVELGTIDGDPEVGEHRFDVTKALQDAPPPTDSNPTIFFGIYSPTEDLKSENEGQHVLFGGESGVAPRLIIAE